MRRGVLLLRDKVLPPGHQGTVLDLAVSSPACQGAALCRAGKFLCHAGKGFRDGVRRRWRGGWVFRRRIERTRRTGDSPRPFTIGSRRFCRTSGRARMSVERIIGRA